MTTPMKRDVGQMAAPPLLFLLLLLFLSNAILPTAAVQFHWTSCNGTANFTANSAFEQNLSKTLLFLINSTSQKGYSNTTIGSGANGVTALAICRGDLGQSDCQTCIEAGAVRIRQRCLNQTTAQIWYDDCWMRYSNAASFSQYDGEAQYYYPSSMTVPRPAAFNSMVGDFMGSLSREAAAADSKFAAGKIKFSDLQWIYGLVQCEPDLRELQCKDCLTGAVGDRSDYCAGNWSCVLACTSCSIRFSLDPFYNESAVTSPLSSEPPLPPVQGRNSSGGSSKGVAVGVAMAAIGIVCFVVGVCAWLVVKRRKKRKRRDGEGFFDTVEMDGFENVSLFFDSKSLSVATDGFSDSNRLGQGGFGPVYKGRMSDGKEIAVKQLSMHSTQGVVEFLNEVKLLLNIQHKNLVLLLGCCYQGGQKMLVYEYLPNKSLDTFLFGKQKNVMLDWRQRFDIILGIARGLFYLHEESQLKIIHRDIKASNILLDDHMNPKISDFGLARLFPEEKTHIKTQRIAGTYGYMAPEYAIHGILSTKCDVFSFGVLVLEIVSGMRNNDGQLCEARGGLLSQASKLAGEGKLMELVDINLDSFLQDEVTRCIQIGLLCCQAKADDRPTMSSVLLILSDNSIIIPSLGKLGYQISKRRIDSRSSGKSADCSTNSQNNQLSSNSITMSLINGR